MANLLLDLIRGKNSLPSTPVPGLPLLGSPWSSSTSVQALAYSDFFQGEIAQITRETAMQIPAISRARSILVGVLAVLPLIGLDARDEDVTPSWLYRTAGPTPVWHRMAWTIDDLLFHGASLWTVERNGSGTILEAARVPYERWDVREDTILVDNQPVASDRVLYIPGADEGLLLRGAPTIKGARAIERAWVGRAQNPIPLLNIQQVSDDPLEDDEVRDLITAWGEARTSPTGAVGFSDNRVKLEALGTVQTDLFVEARNAAVLDVARLTNIPAALLDGSMSTATLTYSTQEGRANEFAAFSIPYWTAPIEARLSQDDVVPEGVRVRFDQTSLTRLPQPTTSTETKD